MRSLLRKLRAGWKLRRVRRALGHALALHRRGEVRSDGLDLLEASVKLSVSWRARGIHPWDRELPEQRTAGQLLDQTLHDTEDAVERIFAAFPEASTLELDVFENDPSSNRVVISGAVDRSDVGRCDSSSIAMRLRMLGINYRVENRRLEVLKVVMLPSDQPQISSPEGDTRRPVAKVRRPVDAVTKSRSGWRDSDHS
jgi:hypothetical protein